MYRSSIAFLSWTLFSFGCHYCAKQYVSWQPGAVSAALLTLAQLAACLLLLRPSTEDGDSPGGGGVGGRALAVLTHACATFATNYSLALMYAPSTLTIKLLEPVMSAMVVWLVTGRPMAPSTMLALLILLAGSVAFVGNPLSSVQLGAGTALALISNAFYGLRNVIMKHVTGSDLERMPLSENVLYLLSAVLGVWCTAAAHSLLEPVLLLLGSAVCHTIYSYVSTCVILQYLSVVGHAVANISKRLIVVLLMIAVAGRTLEPTRFLWLGVCAVGLCLYAYQKVGNNLETEDKYSKRQQTIVITTLSSVLLLLLLITCLYVSHAQSVSDGRQSDSGPINARRSVRPHNIGYVKQTMGVWPGDPDAPSRPSSSQLDQLEQQIVHLLETVIGRKKNVILSGFPRGSLRADAMETAGLLYALKALEADTANNSLLESSSAPKFEHATRQLVIVLASDGDKTCERVAAALQLPAVTTIVIMLASVHNSNHAISQQQLKSCATNDKVQLLGHDADTVSAVEAVGFRVLLLPCLALNIPRVYRFLKPLYHFVFLQKDTNKEKGCEYVSATSPTLRCDSRSWNHSMWTTPHGHNYNEDVYLSTYIGYLFLLRGQVVIVDELAALIVALLFDMPVVAITAHAPEMSAYLDTWNTHGYDLVMRAASLKEAAEIAMATSSEHPDRLAPFEPGITIFKTFTL